jgi:4-diphosphocytidyl-2-C-methyl-D-erythritol kinase
MMWTTQALAKINVDLRVLGRRADGYHEIDTRFVAVDLADTLAGEDDTASFRLITDDIRLPVDDGNLVVRAGKALAAAAGIRPSGRVQLIKRIPIGGGLGGGSADAAAALRLLSSVWDVRLPEDRLVQIAARLGADVPYFLLGGHARGRGRGDLVEALPDLPRQDLLLIVPPFSVSTAAVYAALAGSQGEIVRPTAGRLLVGNDLAPAVLRIEPRMEEFLRAVRSVCVEAMISGSGSTIVAVPANPGDRARVASLLPQATVIATRTVARSEYEVRTRPGQRGASE